MNLREARTNLNRRLVRLALCVCLAADISAASAQGPSTAPDPAVAPVPAADPSQFMRDAAKATSLVEPDMKPWHLRAKYQQIGPDGAVMHEGVLEIWWAAPDQYRTSYTSAEFTQTEYRHGADTNVTGQAGWPPVLERQVFYLLLHPMPEASTLGKKIEETDTAVGSAKLRCYSVKTHQANAEDYCFDLSLPALQMIAVRAASVTAFQGIVRLHDHYLAQKVRVQEMGKRSTNIDVEQMDSGLGVLQQDLAPPADARPSPTHDFFLNPSQFKVVQSVNVNFPLNLKRADRLGMTTVRAIVTEAGTVEDPYAVGGPPALQQAAVEAVKKYRLRPAMLSGLPIAVEFSVVVNDIEY